jgi:hypothetical protein
MHTGFLAVKILKYLIYMALWKLAPTGTGVAIDGSVPAAAPGIGQGGPREPDRWTAGLAPRAGPVDPRGVWQSPGRRKTSGARIGGARRNRHDPGRTRNQPSNADARGPTADDRLPTADDRWPNADNRRPTADDRRSTVHGRRSIIPRKTNQPPLFPSMFDVGRSMFDVFFRIQRRTAPLFPSISDTFSFG